MVREVLRSLGQDASWAGYDLVANQLAGSFLTPRAARFALWRAMGVQLELPVIIFSGCTMVGGAPLSIGRGTFVNRECYFERVGPISIGSETQIGMQAAFITSTHPFGDDGRFAMQPTGLPVVVGDRCWIGARATILPGVTVGDDVVVAAGAVVAKDCAPRGLYGGVPARRIRDIGPTDPQALADGSSA